ncbi:MAG TPA: hypothetical protein VGE07_04470 [Herpetosiphonaceae bacterium]
MAPNNSSPEWYDDTQAAASQSPAGGIPASGPVYASAPPFRQRRRKLLGVGLLIVGLLMLPRAVFGGHDRDDWGAHWEENARFERWGPRPAPAVPSAPDAPHAMEPNEMMRGDMDREIDLLRGEQERLQNDAEREIELLENQRDREQDNADREIELIQDQLERDQERLELEIEQLQEIER